MSEIKELPDDTKLPDYIKLMFKRLVESGNVDIIKAIKWIERYKNDGGPVRELTNKKYMDNVDYFVSNFHRVSRKVKSLYTAEEMEEIEAGRLSFTAFNEMFTGTLSNGFDYDELPAIVFTIKDKTTDFGEEDRARFNIVSLCDDVVCGLVDYFPFFNLVDFFKVIKSSPGSLEIFSAFESLPFVKTPGFVEKCNEASTLSDTPDELLIALFLIDILHPSLEKQWKCAIEQWRDDYDRMEDYASDEGSDTTSCGYDYGNSRIISNFLGDNRVYMLIKKNKSEKFTR